MPAFTPAAEAPTAPAETPCPLQGPGAGGVISGWSGSAEGVGSASAPGSAGAKLCYFLGFNVNLPRGQPFKPRRFLPCSGGDLLKNKV